MMFDLLSIYFPVAEVKMSIVTIFSIGFVSGIMSGLLGIGGGFISTPLLTSVGVPPAVAVATSAHQIVGASFSSILPRIKPKKVDFKLGITLAFAGVFGAYVGSVIFNYATKMGSINIVISLFYIVLMSFISFISFRSYFKKTSNEEVIESNGSLLPFQVYFKIADIKCSILIPLSLGFFTGILVVIMGVGGGFILVPAMVSIMRIKNDIAVGTSLVQIFLVTILVVLFHIFKTGLLDILLGTILIIGATIGAQISSIIALKIGKRKIINLLLAILTLCVAIKFGFDLFFAQNKDQILIEELMYEK